MELAPTSPGRTSLLISVQVLPAQSVSPQCVQLLIPTLCIYIYLYYRHITIYVDFFFIPVFNSIFWYLSLFGKEWLKQFDMVNDRATILVLWGPFRSGKTRFALSEVFGLKPLKVDVGDGDDLNIQAWDHRMHSHLVLDNVNSSNFIMRWRHVLMGPPEPVQLGQSSTGMYAYNVFLGRKPVICSMDEDAMWERKKWLDANCLVIWVDEKCYIE